MNDYNDKPRKNFDHTFAIRVLEENAYKYDKEGNDGYIQSFRKHDPKTIWKYDQIEAAKPTEYSPRYIQIFKDENGNIDSTTQHKDFSCFDYICALQFFKEYYVGQAAMLNVNIIED